MHWYYHGLQNECKQSLPYLIDNTTHLGSLVRRLSQNINRLTGSPPCGFQSCKQLINNNNNNNNIQFTWLTTVVTTQSTVKCYIFYITMVTHMVTHTCWSLLDDEILQNFTWPSVPAVANTLASGDMDKSRITCSKATHHIIMGISPLLHIIKEIL